MLSTLDMISSGALHPANRTYLLSAAGREEVEYARLELLERIFDPATRQQLQFVMPGWRCLEIGAGRGSISGWLAERVGDMGHMVATDIDVSGLKHLSAKCEVLQHDIASDSIERLGLASFDLVFSRFVLAHLHLFGCYESCVRRLVELLKPGGILVVEELDQASCRSANPWHPLAREFDQVVQHAKGMVRVSSGCNLSALFYRCGLAVIRHEASSQLHAGASEAARFYIETVKATVASIDRAGIASGLEREEMNASADVLVKCLADPQFLFLGHLHHAVVGQRLHERRAPVVA